MPSVTLPEDGPFAIGSFFRGGAAVPEDLFLSIFTDAAAFIVRHTNSFINAWVKKMPREVQDLRNRNEHDEHLDQCEVE